MPDDTKWTPGPWSAENNELWQDICVVTPQHDPEEPTTAVIAHLPSVRPNGQVWRNAHLIAAAPDLYEALAEFVESAPIRGNADGSGWEERRAILTARFAKARAALAKARGESQGEQNAKV